MPYKEKKILETDNFQVSFIQCIRRDLNPHGVAPDGF